MGTTKTNTRPTQQKHQLLRRRHLGSTTTHDMRRKRNRIRQNDGTKQLPTTCQQIQKPTRPPWLRRSTLRIPTKLPKQHRKTQRTPNQHTRRRHTQIRTTHRRTSKKNTTHTTKLARRTIHRNRLAIRTRSKTRTMAIQRHHMVRTNRPTKTTQHTPIRLI